MTQSTRVWVDRIEVSGLAGSDKPVMYDLNSDINIFYGINGSGKTSLLKLINAAAMNQATNISSIPFKSAKFTMNYYGVWKLIRTIENTAYSETKGVTAPVLSQTVLPQMMAVPSILGGEPPLSWQSALYYMVNDEWKLYEPEEGKEWGYLFPHQYLPTSRLYLGLEIASQWERHQFTEHELEESFAKLITEKWKEYNYEVSTRTGQIQAEGLASILKDVLSTGQTARPESDIDMEQAYNRVTTFLIRQNVTDILNSFDEFSTRIKTQPYMMNIINDINNVEEQIEKTTIPKTKLQDLITRLYSGNVRLTFDETKVAAKTKEDKEISLGTLSAGQKHLLRILLATLMANDTPILIDEPEMSLHVDWQSELVGAMRELSPSTQIIIATHSPEIAASVDDDKLFRL
jgi:ABC-type Mn2+/Zn2+ transport system ATPase subunit